MLVACKKKTDVVEEEAAATDEAIEVEELPEVYYRGGEYDLVANVADVAWTIEPAGIGTVYQDGAVSHVMLHAAGAFVLTGRSASLADTLSVRGTSLDWTLLVQQAGQWKALSEIEAPADGRLVCSLGVIDAGSGAVTHLPIAAYWVAEFEGEQPFAQPGQWEGSQLSLQNVTAPSPWTLSVVYGIRRITLTIQ